jgi:hypothetical protein
MGKQRGAAVPFMILCSALKDMHALTRPEVVSNLTYLISEGYVDVIDVPKSFTTRHGTVIPSVTRYYRISAAGINKIGADTEFKREASAPIRVEANGQNVFTLGDNNRVAVNFDHRVEDLWALREAVKAAPELPIVDKLDLVTDINLLQAQLTMPNPDRGVLRTLWRRIENAAVVAGLGDALARVGPWILDMLT